MSILDFFSDMDGEPDDSKRALRFRDIWARSTVAMALSDANGIILDANPAYYRLFGYEPSEVLFHSFAIIFPPEQRAWAEARYHEMFQRTGPESVVETFARHKDGTERWVLVRYTFLTDPAGRRTKMLSLIEDVVKR